MRRGLGLEVREALSAPEGKRRYNELHFAEAASRYDLATKAMSLGRDPAWKRALVAALPDHPSPRCVDLACGTGDVAFLLARRFPRGRVEAIDLSAPMLDRARKRNRYPNVSFSRQDLCDLSFSDGSVDRVTGSYAVRNAPDLVRCLREIHRVLRPGGTAALLDFSRPASPLLRSVQHRTLRGWCGLWGLLLHGNPEIHGYVAESLARFPDRPAWHSLLRREGFRIAGSRRFLLGITELLLLVRAD